MRFRHLHALAAAGLLAVGAAGCASSSQHPHAAAPRATPAAFTSPSANPVAVPPISARALISGSDAHRITETIVAFYRASWQGQASAACRLFSPAGRLGFLHAAAVAFPQGVSARSSCAHAMAIYNAALGDSVSNTEAADPSFSPAALDTVGVSAITMRGNRAAAIAPDNLAELINPQEIDLVRTAGRWQIDGSRSLNKSNLPQILARARAGGLLKRHR
jgi:hypothetical protein